MVLIIFSCLYLDYLYIIFVVHVVSAWQGNQLCCYYHLHHSYFGQTQFCFLEPFFLYSFRFTGNVKLKGIIVIGGEEDMHPAKMKL